MRLLLSLFFLVAAAVVGVPGSLQARAGEAREARRVVWKKHSKRKGKRKNGGQTLVVTGGFLLAGGIFGYYLRRKKKGQEKSIFEAEEEEGDGLDLVARTAKIKEVRPNILGKGGRTPALLPLNEIYKKYYVKNQKLTNDEQDVFFRLLKTLGGKKFSEAKVPGERGIAVSPYAGHTVEEACRAIFRTTNGELSKPFNVLAADVIYDEDPEGAAASAGLLLHPYVFANCEGGVVQKMEDLVAERRGFKNQEPYFIIRDRLQAYKRRIVYDLCSTYKQAKKYFTLASLVSLEEERNFRSAKVHLDNLLVAKYGDQLGIEVRPVERAELRQEKAEGAAGRSVAGGDFINDFAEGFKSGWAAFCSHTAASVLKAFKEGYSRRKDVSMSEKMFLSIELNKLLVHAAAGDTKGINEMLKDEPLAVLFTNQYTLEKKSVKKLIEDFLGAVGAPDNWWETVQELRYLQVAGFANKSQADERQRVLAALSSLFCS